LRSAPSSPPPHQCLPTCQPQLAWATLLASLRRAWLAHCPGQGSAACQVATHMSTASWTRQILLQAVVDPSCSARAFLGHGPAACQVATPMGTASWTVGRAGHTSRPLGVTSCDGGAWLPCHMPEPRIMLASTLVSIARWTKQHVVLSIDSAC
jgi:hypothetical protein